MFRRTRVYQNSRRGIRGHPLEHRKREMGSPEVGASSKRGKTDEERSGALQTERRKTKRKNAWPCKTLSMKPHCEGGKSRGGGLKGKRKVPVSQTNLPLRGSRNET